MRFRADRSLRILDRTGERVPVLGGSPLRLWRLTGAGGELVARLAAGDDVVVAAGSPTAALVDRLLDAGALHPDPTSLPSRCSPSDVTVVVPVRDRPDALDGLLSSLGPFRDAGAGLVVVDDGSVDGPAHERVSQRHGATYIRRDRSGGPGVARDDGIATVTTPLVAIVDSDCVVPAGAGRWWEPLLRLFDDDRVAAVAPRVRTPPGPALLARYEGLRSPLDMGADPARVSPGTRVSYVPAAALVLRTDAHRAVGGFDPDLSVGEDVDLVWRLADAGHRIRYEPTAVLDHPPRRGLGAWMRQRVGYGSSAGPLDARHPWRVAPVRCSPWSAAGWAAIVLGPGPAGPIAGAAILGISAALLPRRLADVRTGAALRLAVSGHGAAGVQLARAAVRVWWPVLLAASTVSRRARRVAAVAVAVTAADAAVSLRREDPALGAGPLAAIVGLGLLDDAAYGAGVWIGALRVRSPRALLPAFPRSAHRF